MSIIVNSGWNSLKVANFRAAFMEFLKLILIDSKDKGGSYRLADGLYEAQHRFLDGIFDGLSNDVHDFKILKSRQLGISTISEALFVFYLGMFPGIQAACIYDTAPHLRAARMRIRNLIKRLPSSLNFGQIAEDSRDLLSFKNGTVVNWIAAGVRETESSGGLGRGSGCNLVWASEVSSWKNEEGLISLIETFSETFPDRLYIWESPLAINTPLLTPYGWTTIGSIKVGDFVYGEDGKETEVVGLSPVFEGRRCFEIEFDTGEKIISDAGHKWQVERMGSSCSRWSTEIVTTQQIDPLKDRIWLGDPVTGIEQNLPIHPYFLGAWLGDGHNEAIRITCGDKDMQEMRENLKSRGVAVGPITKFKGRGGGVFGIRGLMPTFRGLNLINNKHIPDVYLRSETEDRLELLRGLMDTDGSIVKQGRCSFTNSCRALVNDICELLSSLGIRFKVDWFHPGEKQFSNGKVYSCRPYAIVGFTPPESMEVFSLKRKLERHDTGMKRRPRRNLVTRIVSINEVQSVPVKCISVSSPSHLFKVGKTMIPTHNTARGYNHWRDMWMDAEKDDLNQKGIFIGWWAHPDHNFKRTDRRFERYGSKEPTASELKIIEQVRSDYNHEITMEQIAWYRWKIDPTRDLEDGEKKGSQYKQQEQASVAAECFTQAGSSFFDHISLNEHTQKIPSFPRSKNYRYSFGPEFVHTIIVPAVHYREVELRVWDPPLQNVRYIVAADVAYGRNPDNDRSCCQVIACYADCIEQVAEYASATTNTTQFAWVVASLAAYYSNVNVIMEIDGPGESVWKEYEGLPRLIRSPYVRKMSEERGLQDVFNNVRNYIFNRPDSMAGRGNNWQWKTGNRKEAIMEKLKSFTSTNQIVIKSMDTIDEMRTMARDGAAIEAPSHKKDDRVLALAFAVRCWEDEVRPDLLARGITKQAYLDAQKVTTAARYDIFMQNTISNMFTSNMLARKRADRQARLAQLNRRR